MSTPQQGTVAAGTAGPLAGIRVVDLTSVIMGPYATQILGDLGADVITVEEPRGALNRVMTPGPHEQLSGVALNLLRNKRSVVLDLKTDAGHTAVTGLIRSADVFVTNLRPEPLRRLALTYADAASLRPDIIYCQAQGWPSDSPLADAPAYDDIVQAASGIPDAFRIAHGAPQFVPTIIADKVCGLTIAYAVLAALVGRNATGNGAHLEVPMVDVMTAFTLVEHAGARTAVPASGSAGYARILNSQRQPQRTLDGWISVLPYSKSNYQDLFRAGGRHDLLDDRRIRGARARVANAGPLYGLVAEIVAHQTTAHWLQYCADHDIPAAEIASLDSMVDGLPVDTHPDAGQYHVLPQPVRVHGAAASPVVRRPAALPGAHTREVLVELGFDDSFIEELTTGADTSVGSDQSKRGVIT